MEMYWIINYYRRRNQSTIVFKKFDLFPKTLSNFANSLIFISKAIKRSNYSLSAMLIVYINTCSWSGCFYCVYGLQNNVPIIILNCYSIGLCKDYFMIIKLNFQQDNNIIRQYYGKKRKKENKIADCIKTQKVFWSYFLTRLGHLPVFVCLF